MGVEGVRSVNKLKLVQEFSDATGEFLAFLNKDGEVTGGDSRYNYLYDFNQFYNDTTSSDGVILPSVEPSVFELKFPNKDIRGKVL